MVRIKTEVGAGEMVYNVKVRLTARHGRSVDYTFTGYRTVAELCGAIKRHPKFYSTTEHGKIEVRNLYFKKFGEDEVNFDPSSSEYSEFVEQLKDFMAVS